MPQDTYEITGFEVVSKTVKPHGNGARVLVPRDWVGEEATVIRRTKQDENATIAPTAALMYDEVKTTDATLREAIQKVVRFQSFQDVNSEIADDFRECLNSEEGLQQSLLQTATQTNNNLISDFYMDIAEAESGTALKIALKNWV